MNVSLCGAVTCRMLISLTKKRSFPSARYSIALLLPRVKKEDQVKRSITLGRKVRFPQERKAIALLPPCHFQERRSSKERDDFGGRTRGGLPAVASPPATRIFSQHPSLSFSITTVSSHCQSMPFTLILSQRRSRLLSVNTLDAEPS